MEWNRMKQISSNTTAYLSIFFHSIIKYLTMEWKICSIPLYSIPLYFIPLRFILFVNPNRAFVFSIHHHSFIAPPIGRYDIIVGSWGRGSQSLINTLSLEQQHNWLLSPHFCSKSQGIIRFMDSLIYMLLNINSSIQCET
jgi:hypothetical protein